LDVFVIGPRDDQRVRDLERLLRASGSTVQLTILEDGAVPVFGAGGAVLVLFEGSHSRAAEYASKVREGTRYQSVHLIVVRASEGAESAARLLAAGAAAVCESDCNVEQIAAEVRTRCDMQPVLDEIRQTFLGPFTSATKTTIKEMAGLDVEVSSVYQKRGYRMFGDISAVLGLVGQSEGSLVLSFPDATATRLVKRILADFDGNAEEGVVRDCIGEVANIVAGQARGPLANTPYHFTLSTPTIISGANHEIRHKPGAPCLVVAFTSELGDFALQICMAL
jgi:chemotaxis protein CheX